MNKIGGVNLNCGGYNGRMAAVVEYSYNQGKPLSGILRIPAACKAPTHIFITKKGTGGIERLAVLLAESR